MDDRCPQVLCSNMSFLRRNKDSVSPRKTPTVPYATPTGMTSEATDDMIDRRWWLLIAMGWAAFMLLGSWYPFHYRAGMLRDAWSAWSSGGALQSQATTDLAVNVLLGIPLAFFGTLALLSPHDRAVSAAKDASRSRRLPRGGDLGWSFAYGLAVVGLVVVCVSVWALLGELGQHWFGYRVPSRADTLAQSLGGMLGAVVAWCGGAWFCDRVATVLGWQGHRSPLAALLDLYVAGYIGWMLMPFVPVSPTQLAAKWRSGSIQFSPVADWQSNPWQAGYTMAVSMATALPLGCWIAWRSRGRVAQRRFVRVALAAAFIVVMLEVCQIFVATRTMALDDAIWSAVGAIAGVWTYKWGLPSRATRHWMYWLTAPRLVISTILFLMVYILVAWAPFEFVDSSADLQQRLRRFASVGAWLAGNDMLQASSLIRSLFWSAPLGALAAMAARASGSSKVSVWTAAAIFCAIVCSATEFGQIASRAHTPSLVDLATRLVGSLGGLAIFRSLTWRFSRHDED